MHNPKLLGITTQLNTQPLAQVLRVGKSFQIVEGPRPDIARQLCDRELSAAILSPLEYAKDSSDYCIVPRAAAVSRAGNASIVIRFREGITHLRSLAVDPGFASEIVLAKIILSEAFDVEPVIHPMVASLDVMLQKTDAALIVGDTAFREHATSGHIIDLVEEWNEMTGLPYVHALWCGREGDLTKDDIQSLQDAAVKGVEGIGDIAQGYPKEEQGAVIGYLESFSYSLDDESTDGLAEFMKYLYYHGILSDVPELNFYRPDEPKDDFL